MGRAGIKRTKKRPAPRPLPKIGEPRKPPTLSGSIRTWFLRYPAEEMLPLPASPLLPRPEPRPWADFRWAGWIACVLGIGATGALAARRARRRSARRI